MMNKAIDEYKERNKTAPHMILIDIKPEGGIETEKDRDLRFLVGASSPVYGLLATTFEKLYPYKLTI